MYNEYFSNTFIVLNEELQNHPALLINLLQLPKDSPVEMKLGEIAAFCGIILDGMYTPEQVEELCEECIKRLRHARLELVTDFAPPKQ